MKLNPLGWFATTRDQAEEWSLGDDAVLQAFYGALSAVSASGVRVTQESALRSVAVLACLIVRAETFSALPVDVLRKEGAAAVHDEADPAYRLLAVAPNELMTAREFWRHKQITEDVAGNAFARVVWKGSEPREIWPLYGQKPVLHIDAWTRRVAWEYAGDDFTPAGAYPLEDLLHFKGPVLQEPARGALPDRPHERDHRRLDRIASSSSPACSATATTSPATSRPTATSTRRTCARSRSSSPASPASCRPARCASSTAGSSTSRTR